MASGGRPPEAIGGASKLQSVAIRALPPTAGSFEALSEGRFGRAFAKKKPVSPLPKHLVNWLPFHAARIGKIVSY
jgi:hypothetical protein